MIKQLSSTLLAVSIISLNVLPASALTKTTNTGSELNAASNNTQNVSRWCVLFPGVGYLCWDL
jgi:hypothetical protein